MQPGKPQGFGTVGEDEIPIVTLPGNPVSSYISFEHVRAAGDPQADGPTAVRPARRPRPCSPTACARRTAGGSSSAATLSVVDGRVAVTPVGGHGSHLIGDLAESNALIVVPEAVTSVDAGETVTVLPLDEEF